MNSSTGKKKPIVSRPLERPSSGSSNTVSRELLGTPPSSASQMRSSNNSKTQQSSDFGRFMKNNMDNDPKVKEIYDKGRARMEESKAKEQEEFKIQTSKPFTSNRAKLIGNSSGILSQSQLSMDRSTEHSFNPNESATEAESNNGDFEVLSFNTLPTLQNIAQTQNVTKPQNGRQAQS